MSTQIEVLREGGVFVQVGLSLFLVIESDMLLNQKGVENLLGKGDLLVKDTGDPVRLQSPLLAPEKRAAIFSGQGKAR